MTPDSGIVAVGSPGSFCGVPADVGAPTVLGAQLWEHLDAWLYTGGGLKQFVRNLLRFPSWEMYLNGGLCRYCGRFTSAPVIGPDSAIRFLEAVENLHRVEDVYRWLTENLAALRKQPEFEVREAFTARPMIILPTLMSIMRLRVNRAVLGTPDPWRRYHRHARPLPMPLLKPESLKSPWPWLYVVGQVSGRTQVSLLREDPARSIVLEIGRDKPNWLSIERHAKGEGDV